MQRFDWGTLLRAGVRGLGLKPHEFWQLTPVELRVMLGEDSGAAPMGRSRLDELLSAFPDEMKGDGR